MTERKKKIVESRLEFPEAVLFDFDGVIAYSQTAAGWELFVAEWIQREFSLEQIPELNQQRIARDLLNTTRAISLLSQALTREQYPQEIASEKWLDYLCLNWPEGVKERLRSRISKIVYMISEHRYIRSYREGTREVLQFLKEHGVKVGLVSNTPCAETSRNVLIEEELTPFFDIEIYSDEVGIRKPNPQIILDTLNAINVAAEDAWFVGDTRDRDIECAYRAKVGTSVYMTGAATDESPYILDVDPDVTVSSHQELLNLLTSVQKQKQA